MRRPVPAFAAVLLALSLVAGACSGDDDTAESADRSVADPSATPATERERTTDSSLPGPTITEFGTETVEFSTPDGVLLQGTLFTPAAENVVEVTDGIVLAHMRGADRSTWELFAQVAAASGHAVLTFDFRGYGGSNGERDTLLDVDLTAAVEHLQRQGAQGVVVMGASMGGTAAVNVASRLDLAGAVSLSAPAEFQGLPALDVAADVEEPLLLLVAEDDEPYADAAESMAGTAPDARLEVLEGGAHGTNLFSDHAGEVTAELLSFAGDPAGSG